MWWAGVWVTCDLVCPDCTDKPQPTKLEALQVWRVVVLLSWSSGFRRFGFLGVWGSRFETTAQYSCSMAVVGVLLGLGCGFRFGGLGFVGAIKL